MLTGTGIFQLQAEIAEQITDALNVVLLAPERDALEEAPTDNQVAYNYYLQGLDYFNRRLVREHAQSAIEVFENAVELDPNFAHAYAGLSKARIWYIWNFTGPRELITKAKEAVDEALALNPNLPEAYLALGDYYYYGSRDYEKAVEQYEYVLELRPDDNEAKIQIGWIHRRQGRWEEANAILRQALELNPRHYSMLYGLGVNYAYMRQYSDAEYFFGRAISLFPDLPTAYDRMALTYLLIEGNQEKTAQFLEDHRDIIIPHIMTSVLWAPPRILRRVFPDHFDIVRDRPSDTVSVHYYIARAGLAAKKGQTSLATALYDSAWVVLETEYQGQSHNRAALCGLVQAGLGNKSEAIRFSELAEDLMPVGRDALIGTRTVTLAAEIYVTVGDYEAAIDRLDYLLSIPSHISVPLLRIDPIWDPLRDHPRFQALLEKYK